MKNRTFALSLLALVSALGCQGTKTGSTHATSPNPFMDDPWIILRGQGHDDIPALLSNGLIGIRASKWGGSVDVNGPLPYSLDGDFSPNGEEKRAEHSDWLPGQPSPTSGEGLQFLDLRSGKLINRHFDANGRSVDTELYLDPNKPVAYRGESVGGKVESWVSSQIGPTCKVLPGSGSPPDFSNDWKRFWECDISVDGPTEDQRAIRSFLFYLRTSVHPDSKFAPGPYGLSSATYNGHVFWDADLWMFPVLALLDPARAKVIPNYRIARFAAAQENYKRWVANGRQTPHSVDRPFLSGPAIPGAAMYPWESALTGLETMPGPSRHEHHISGTVLIGLQMAANFGLVDPSKVRSIGAAVAKFYQDRCTYSPNGEIELLDTLSPDENKVADNDLYTNLVARNALMSFAPEFYNAHKGMALPHDATGLLTYDGDPVRTYKQAAAVLAVFPLQAPEAEPNGLAMVERFAPKVTPYGPSMSDAIHAVILARNGESQRAYDMFKKESDDYLNGPLNLFSEKRNRPATFFATGAAGALQAVLYGFAGIRLDKVPQPGATATLKLKSGAWISITPHLPSQWRTLQIKGLTFDGVRYVLSIAGDKVSLSKQDPG